MKPKLLLYEKANANQQNISWLNDSTMLAQAFGWLALPFSCITFAAEELDESFSALATSIPEHELDGSITDDTSRLIKLSNELSIPRAIITRRTDAAEFIREASSDRVITYNTADQVTAKLQNWLGGLAYGAIKPL